MLFLPPPNLVLNLQNPVFGSHLEHTSIGTSHILSAQWPHVVSGHHRGQCRFRLERNEKQGLFLPGKTEHHPGKKKLGVLSRRFQCICLISSQVYCLPSVVFRNFPFLAMLESFPRGGDCYLEASGYYTTVRLYQFFKLV